MSEGYKTLKELVVAKGLTYDDLIDSYSDLYKDVWGVRPRGNVPETLDELIADMEWLQNSLGEELDREEVKDREEEEAVQSAMAPAPEVTLGDLVDFDF